VNVTEDAVFFSKITKNVWGIVWSRDNKPRPAICDFTFTLQKGWLARTPEKEVRRFIEAMVSTDEVGRSRLVETAVAEARAGK
jgi:hypothetical protein